MDSGDTHSGVPCNITLRDITNTEEKGRHPISEEQTRTHINDLSDRKRKRPQYQAPSIYDKGKNEVIHATKDYETCRNVKGKVLSLNAKQYDSQYSKENFESQEGRLVDKLSLRGAYSGQTSSLNIEADDSLIGPLASSSSEDEDLSTESDEPKESFGLDEQFLRHSVHPVKDHEAVFSDHTSLDCSSVRKKKGDVGKIAAHENFQNISLCGSCPCSSCIKAAYMWSDLIHQDTRGKLRALKSSRRHARMLEGKILKHEKAGETSKSQPKKAKSTESDLLQHWTSLFRHTEDTLLCEIVQAQSRLMEIEKLKIKLKRDLEAIDNKPQNESEEFNEVFS